MILLSELIDGTSLRDYITSTHPVPVPIVLDFGAALLDALIVLYPNVERIEQLRSLDEMDDDSFAELRDLEARGLVHRDIKPENLLVRRTGELVLIDFGISSQVGSAVHTVSGTPGYTPPNADLTRWTTDTDLYAAGAVMFELACGRLPTRRSDGEQIDPRHLRPEIPDA